MTRILYKSMEGGVKKIILNRPEKRNALSYEMMEELLVALKMAETEAKVLLIEGAGSNFCSGLDLNEISERSFILISELFIKLAHFPCPTVAVIQGGVAAGGMGLIAAADFAHASRDSFFLLPELKKGVYPLLVGVLLQSVLSERHYKELCFTCNRMEAQRAFEIGLIQGLDLGAVPHLVGSLLELDLSAFNHYKKHLNQEKQIDSRLKEALKLQLERYRK